MDGTFMYAITITAAAMGFLLGYRMAKRSKQDKEYWRGRLEGWQACEGMVIDRALEAGLKDKDGDVMDRGKLWEELVQ